MGNAVGCMRFFLYFFYIFFILHTPSIDGAFSSFSVLLHTLVYGVFKVGLLDFLVLICGSSREGFDFIPPYRSLYIMDDDKCILGDVIVWSLLGRGGVNRFTYQHLKLMKNKNKWRGISYSRHFHSAREARKRGEERWKGKERKEKKRRKKKKGQEN